MRPTVRGTYMLCKPVVAVRIDAGGTTTLPSGADVELHNKTEGELVQVKCQQQWFTVHLPDLLDAFRVEDVGEITWLGLGRSSSVAE